VLDRVRYRQRRQREAAVGRRSGARATVGRKAYPTFGFEPMPDPDPGRAIDQSGVRPALWRKASSWVRAAGIAMAGAVCGLATAAVTGPVGVVGASVALGSGVVLLGTSARLARFGLRWRYLSRTRWLVLRCTLVPGDERSPVVVALDVRDMSGRRWICRATIRRSRRSEQLLAMGRREIWFAGDPARRGILTVAGGGDMFGARCRAAPADGRAEPGQRPQFASMKPLLAPAQLSARRYATALVAARYDRTGQRPRNGRARRRKRR
jgi:hypothetical protein